MQVYLIFGWVVGNTFNNLIVNFNPMSSRGKSAAGGVTLFSGLILLNVFVPFPLVPYLLIGVLGGLIIEEKINATVIFVGIGFLSLLVSVVGMASKSDSTLALIALGLGILNTIGILFGGVIGLVLADVMRPDD
jgi:hypothetical protein